MIKIKFINYYKHLFLAYQSIPHVSIFRQHVLYYVKSSIFGDIILNFA